jgi:hypothetical protein
MRRSTVLSLPLQSELPAVTSDLILQYVPQVMQVGVMLSVAADLMLQSNCYIGSVQSILVFYRMVRNNLN